MNYQLPKQISSEQDVYDFFRYIYYVEDTCFHPDDSFCDYINAYTKEKAFDDETCARYDYLMSQARLVCGKISADRIYEIGLEIDETPTFLKDHE